MNDYYKNLTDEVRQNLNKLWKLLSAKFPEEHIERTWHAEKKDQNGNRIPGSGTGKGYDTTAVKAQALRDRLNEVVGIGQWKFEVVKKTPYEATLKRSKWEGGKKQIVDAPAHGIYVEAVLEIPALGFVSPVSPGEHVSIEMVDAEKGAITGAFKYACAWLSMGNHCWLDEVIHIEESKDEPAPPPPKQQKKQESKPAKQETPAPPAPNTESQVKLIAANMTKIYQNIKDDQTVQAAAIHHVKKLTGVNYPAKGSTVSDYLRSLGVAAEQKVLKDYSRLLADSFEVLPSYSEEDLIPALEYLNRKG